MSNSTTINMVDLLKTFDDQGYIVLREFFEPSICEEVKADLLKITDKHIDALLEAGKIQDRLSALPWETRLDQIYQQCVDDPPTVFREELHEKGFYPLFCHPRLLDIVEAILGPEVRLYPNYSIRPKFPDNEAMLVFWHQDAAYTDEMNSTGSVSQSRMVNVWTPLVPATTENGCMQFVPETHKLGLVGHSRVNRFYLKIEEQHLNPRLDQAVDIELNPGDVVLFSNLLFHQGLPNRSEGIRWSADWRYQDATQSTLREEGGHLVRSQAEPDKVVQSADRWTELSFV
jgi:phytanoyl-CoA hydroxylase